MQCFFWVLFFWLIKAKGEFKRKGRRTPLFPLLCSAGTSALLLSPTELLQSGTELTARKVGCFQDCRQGCTALPGVMDAVTCTSGCVLKAAKC